MIVAELLDKHGLRLRFDEVVHHDDNDAVRERLAQPVAPPRRRDGQAAAPSSESGIA